MPQLTPLLLTTISDLIDNIDQLDEMTTAFAKKPKGVWLPTSEVLLFPILEDDGAYASQSDQIAEFFPEHHYFLELFIIKELLDGINNAPEYKSPKAKIARIIYYAENDA